MAESGGEEHTAGVAGAPRAVFISYASQDAEAASRICEALRAAGIEVWFDQTALRGGDAWDAMIRRQIKACYLFVPVISSNTQSREEGYFRREWKLAVERTHDMADSRAFLLPIVIDGTSDADALVPEKFREVQWTRLSIGTNADAFIERVRWLVSPEGTTPTASSVRPPSLKTSTLVARSTRSKTFRSRSFVLSVLGGTLILVVGYLIANKYVASRAAAPVATDAVAPYSAEDRRMTFALLPLRSATDDHTAQDIAKATGEVVFKSLEGKHEWVKLASRDSAEQALREFSAPRELARALNVHFLMRGDVARANSAYAVTLYVVDGATEHVLGSMKVPIPANALVPRWNDEIDDAVGSLVRDGLEAEVERARNKPDAALDVRDLVFRAYVDWGHNTDNDPKAAYLNAEELLKRALTLAPNDALALRITAKVNLCDCLQSWSPNVEVQRKIGEAAVDRYLSLRHNSSEMLLNKAWLYIVRGRFQEALVILDSALNRDPQDFTAIYSKAFALLRLGQPQEARAPATAAYNREADSADDAHATALLAAVDYELADYADAARLARQSSAKMSKAQLSNPNSGAVRLTLIAASAHLNDYTTVKSAVADLRNDSPDLTTVTAIRKWMHPQADLYGYEPLFDGLRLAGLPE